MKTPANNVQERNQQTKTKRLAGKVALVTGGSRGIGAGIALRLAEEGARVAISYNNNKNAANAVVDKIAEVGSEGLAFQADVSSAEATQDLLETLIKRFGKLDILVNNAGVFELLPVENSDIEHYERIFDVNVKGVLSTTIAALPHISNGGRIVNISSVASTSSLAGGSVYSASKAALDSFTRIWAQDLGARKITVNAVAPGATATDMYDQGLPDEEKRAIVSKTALGRAGEPSDIAAVVAFLASEDGGWVTGQIIRADGGLNF